MGRFLSIIYILLVFLWIHSIIGQRLTRKLINSPKSRASDPQKNLRVTGGEVIRLEKVPFNVQFFNRGGMCGGTILSKKIVLTAAHCFDLNDKVGEMKVFSGSRFVFDPKSESHSVWSFKLHEQYNNTMYFANDIAIIMIKDEFTYSSTVQIAYICNNDDIWRKENESFLVSGWGEDKYGAGVRKQILRTTYMEYITNTRCSVMSRVSLSEEMFCLYGDGERDTCTGDSGGGVFWNGMLVGITSYGPGCASLPSVYVNVFYMKSWINKTVKKLYEQYCLRK